MRKTVVAVLAAGLLAATGGVLYTGAAFGATQCTGEIDGPQTIKANLVVPSGSTCNLQGPGLVINGDLTVQPGGRLVSGGGTVINGNVSSTQAGTDSTTNPFGPSESFSVVMCNTTVKGNTTISQSNSQVLVGGTSAGGGGCGGNNLGGNVIIQNNLGRVSLSENSASDCNIGTCGIGGNATVNGNTGPTFVLDNAIGGNLACSSNGTMTASGNTAKNKSGQCA
jgi:hypothetical protein